MRAWSPAAEDKLRSLYATTPLPRLAFLLKRTEKAIRSRAKVLGIRKSTRRAWTAADNRLLCKRYPHEKTEAIARDLGRKVGQVYQQAQKLGLAKSAEYLASGDACRLNGHEPASKAHRFKRGQASWSKGTKGIVGVQEACRRTQFKKGRPASESRNYRPIGSVRVTRDGALERKVTDDPNVYPARRWVAVPRLVWEAANGPIPPGHAVAFKPGRHSTVEAEITLDALELVSRAELAKRNAPWHRYPKEVTDLIRLKGRLNRKINSRSKQA
jgi:uncharacterized small protein (DUF1192 family)